jgi:hypothetical protein
MKEPAQRYSYDAVAKKWSADERELTVVLSKDDFGEGGLRTVKRMREIEADGSYVELVAKWFKFEGDKRAWYFAEAEAQMVAEQLSQQFNRLSPPPPKQVVVLHAEVSLCLIAC